MSNNETAVTSTVNFVPVQGTFQPAPGFELISLIGPAGTPFYASISPNQSGLNITNSTINSTTIGAISPSTAAFTAGTVAAAPTGAADLVNKQYVDYFVAGLSWKSPVAAASMANITSLSGLLTIDTVTLVAGDTVLVKNQTNAANNGIYVVSAGAWTRSIGADVWTEFVGAIVFVVGGTQGGSAWYCTAQPGGTLGVTAINWSNFSVSSTYSAGTGLTLTGTVFSITPVGTAGVYGSASSVPVLTTNASGQITSVTNTAIAIANTAVSGLGTMSTQNANTVAITGGTINGTTIGATTAAAITGTTITANTQFTGAGTGLTGTASGLSIGGNAATATTATTATNLAGGAAGSLPYQTSTSTTGMLAAGTNGQVLTLAAGVPSWAAPNAGTVTSVAMSVPAFLTVTGSPVTSSGTLAVSYSGTALPLANGGSGQTTAQGAMNAFAGAVTSGSYLRGNGTNVVMSTIQAADVPTLNQNTTGTAANVTGVVAIANGGTNGTSTPTAGAVPYGTGTAYAFTAAGTNGQVLTSAGAGTPTWTTPAGAITVTDDTTTNATRYPLFASVTTGNLTATFASSTKYQFNPSTGFLSINGVSFPDSSTQASAQVGMKNRIIDGGFTINQRAYTSGTSLASGSYGHDRWKGGASAGTYTFTQGSLGVNTTITITAGSIIQVVEGCNLPEGGTYVLSWTGTAQGRLNGGTYGSSGTVTVTGWVAGTNLNVEFNTGTCGNVQLEKGSIATSFDYRPYGTELLLCQRYLPAVIAESTLDSLTSAVITSTTSAYVTLKHPVTARTRPTGVTASAANIITVSGASVTSAISFNNAGTEFTTLVLTSSALVPGVAAATFLNTAGSRILLTGCEL